MENFSHEALYMTKKYEKLFHSVGKIAGLEALKDQGIQKTYIRLLGDNKTCTSRGIIHKPNKYPIRNSVRRGDTISPKPFTAFLEGVFRKLDLENTGFQ